MKLMSSSAKQAKYEKAGVQISKETGGAYIDMREVIESEIARIQNEWNNGPNSKNGTGTIHDPDRHSNNNGHRAG